MIRKQLKSNSPVLVVYDIDDTECQIFVCIDKEIFLECNEDVSYGRALILLLSTYFAFNLQYDTSQVNMFRFLEEYVLKIPLKKRTNKYKRMISNLLN